MRDIKFRLVCKSVTGDLFYRYLDFDTLIRGEYTINTDGLIETIIGKNQYTGLTDKNGKEIYEGDICNARLADGTPLTYEVEIPDVYIATNESDSYYLVDEKTFEVIGNVYENPELLEEGRK